MKIHQTEQVLRCLNVHTVCVIVSYWLCVRSSARCLPERTAHHPWWRRRWLSGWRTRTGSCEWSSWCSGASWGDQSGSTYYTGTYPTSFSHTEENSQPRCLSDVGENWPESAENDHGCGQRHQRRAVPDRVQSFDWCVERVLMIKTRDEHVCVGHTCEYLIKATVQV